MFGWRVYGQFPAEGYSLVCIAGEAAGGLSESSCVLLELSGCLVREKSTVSDVQSPDH